MSEDEKKAIDMLEKYITEHKFYNIKHSDGLEDNIKILLDLYQQEKEKNKKYISKNKITNILGLDSTETEEAILQYIQTLETENARLEDIENKKVQIEYELVFNKGANSIKDKIKEILYAHEPGVSIYLLKELLNKEE